MNLEVFKNNDEVKMSSWEIAELTGKRHDNVVRDIEKLNKSYDDLRFLKIEELFRIRELPNGGHKRESYYELTKMQTLDLMTGYNVELRIKVNRRWEELEKQNSKPLTQAELILVQAQALVDMERKINSVEAKVDKIVKAQEDVMAQLEAIPLIEGEIPEQSARSKVNELVRHYSYISGVSYREVWNAIYKVLLYNYGINVSGIKAVKPNESKFDKAIRVGHLDTIHLDISEMIREYQSKLLDK